MTKKKTPPAAKPEPPTVPDLGHKKLVDRDDPIEKIEAIRNQPARYMTEEKITALIDAVLGLAGKT